MALDNIYSWEVDKIMAAVKEAQRLNKGVPATGPMICAVLVQAGVYENGNLMKRKIMNLVREDLLWCDPQVHRFSTEE